MAVLDRFQLMGPCVPLLIFAAVVMILGLAGVVVEGTSRAPKMRIVLPASFCCVLGAVLVAACLNPVTYIPAGKEQLMVTFATGEPTAAMKERYNIIEQRGSIYVVEEK